MDEDGRRFRLSVSEGRPLFGNEFNKSRGVESGDLRNKIVSSKTKVRVIFKVYQPSLNK